MSNTTDLKKVQLVYPDASLHLAAIVDSSEDAIISKDLNGIITSWNKGAEELFGYTSKEAIGKSVTMLIPEGRLNEEPKIIERIKRGERIQHYETIRRHKSGRELELSLTVSPIKDAQGKIIGASKIARDITEQKKTQRELQDAHNLLEIRVKERTSELVEMNSRFRAMFDQGLFAGVLDLEGNVVEINNSSLVQCGYKREEEMGRPFWECSWWNLDPELQKWVKDGFYKTLKGEVFRGETHYYVAGGHRRIVDFAYMPIRNETGEIVFVMPTGLDITDQERRNDEVKAAEIIRQSEEKFRTLANSAPALIWVNGLTGCEFVNRKYAEFVGAKESDLVGMGWSKFLHPDEASDILKAYQKAFSAKAEYSVQHRFLRYDGQYRWMKSTGIPRFENGQFVGYIGSTTDVTEIKITQEELARSNKELENFAYVISHDLQEPLRMVATYTQLFSKRYLKQFDASAKELLDFAEEGATRSQQLVKDLLEYSRVRLVESSFVKVNLEEVLKIVIANLAIAIKESGAHITFESLPTVMGDQMRLIQLFQNLLSNSIKFGSKKGQCKVTISAEKNERGAWVFSVGDNGIGIDPQHRERIFVIFQRLHNRSQYEGTGIGLAICKKIVEQHNGRIWVESEIGQGATFKFTINPLWN